jgi:glycosyltransferase involved in cell wall biosynthesis
MRTLITIVIPTYNSAEFIKGALDSIYNQTFKEYEVIIIDAGSKDSTRSICQKYGNKYKFIEHKGSKQGEARNTGINNVFSKLIMFLDSDDQLADANVLSDCIDKVKTYDADFYNFSIIFKNESKIIKEINVPNKKLIENNDEIIKNGLLGNNIYTTPWNKIYKTDFLKSNNILFPDMKEQEDMVFMMHCCLEAKKIAFINRKIVMASVRPESLSRTMSSMNVACCIDVFKSIEMMFKNRNLYKLYLEYINLYKMRTSAYIILMTIDRIKSNEDFWRGVELIKKEKIFNVKSNLKIMIKMKISTIISITVARENFLLATLRKLKKIKLIKGY